MLRPLHLIVASVTGAGFGINAVKYAIPALLALAGSAPSQIGAFTSSVAAAWPVFGLLAGLLLDRSSKLRTLRLGELIATASLLFLLALPGPTLGRAVASYRWIGWSAFFAGSVIAGPLADRLGFTGAFAVFAVLNVFMLIGFPFVIPKSQVLDEPLNG